jgi:hypothetical protein
MTIADALFDAKEEIVKYQAGGYDAGLETEIAAVVLTMEWLLEWLDDPRRGEASFPEKPDRAQLLLALQRHFEAAP